MAVAHKNRDRLRSALLGPLGQEATDMLMEEVDQSALRDHIDERFDKQKREIDARFREVDKRFNEVDQQFIAVHAAIKDIGKDTKLIMFSICGAFAVVVVATLFESIAG